MAKRPKQPRPAPTPTDITQPFWDAAKDHKFLLQYDPEADKYQFYPRGISVHTGKQNLEWREVSGRGEVYTWTETVVPARGFEGDEPYLIACVELDEGVRLMSLLHNCTADEVKIGMRVRMSWDKIDSDSEFFAFEPDT
ncbi:MAG: Zn-ribbon domain-containing OB-fold protein [Alphaproteobacteria bacterium]